jgi:peptidoglycan/xylan/chitin deacetylase (PgdA/CDA1 family)
MLIVLAAIVGAFVLAHTAPFPFLVDAAAPGASLWRVPPGPAAPTVYLTFDDGPNPAATPAVLDALARVDARVTFFLIDRWVTAETGPIIRRMFDDGHGVALHSDDRWLLAKSPETLAAVLTAAADRIEQVAGRRPCRAFRPHGGWRSGLMYAGLHRIDHVLVGWGWFAWDWNWFRARSAEAIVERIARRASDGLIVVIHDGHHRRARAERAYAVEAVERLVPALRARGFAFGTICEAIEQVHAPTTPARLRAGARGGP